MLHLVLASLAIGIAGFDPLGFVALIAAMAIGAKRSGVAVLMATVVLSTTLFGLVPALVLGPAVWRLHHAMRGVSHTVWGLLVVAVGIGLLAWGLMRLVRPAAPSTDEGHTPRSASPRALFVTGLMVGLSAYIDPAFYAQIVFASQQHNPVTTTLMILAWVAMSHCALLAVGAATLLGLYQPVHRLIEQVQTRWGRRLAVLGYLALVLVGVFCIVQGIAEWHHHWLVFGSLRPHHRR